MAVPEAERPRHVAVPQARPHFRRGHSLQERNRTHLEPELFEQVRIAGGPPPEPEVLADHDHPRPDASQERLAELSRLLACEVRREVDDERLGHAPLV